MGWTGAKSGSSTVVERRMVREGQRMESKKEEKQEQRGNRGEVLRGTLT